MHDEDRSGPDPSPAWTIDRGWLRRAAFHYLERYAASEARLATVLKRKIARRAAIDGAKADPVDRDAAVAEVLGACRSLGLMDDAALAEMKVASGRRKGLSSRKLAETLVAKGIDRETARAAIAADDTDEDLAALRLARRRRIGPWRRTPSPDRAALDREVAALCRAGYPYPIARSVVGMDLDAAEEKLASDNG